MLEQAVFRGQAAEIRWAYYVAARVEGFTLIRDPNPNRRRDARLGWSVSARLVAPDPFKMAQRPLLFLVTHSKGRMVFPLETVRVSGDVLQGRCGPVEAY